MLVAFSGGGDSTALLWGLRQLAPQLAPALHAAHLDHRLDAGSARRAEHARELAATLGVPLTLEHLDPRRDPAGGESREAWARHRRYAFLEQLAADLRARFILTAHHADDQAETVLLRLLFGSGLEGLQAMAQQRGRLLRPLLPLRRHELPTPEGLVPSEDPTNAELGTPRNAVRARLLPHLEHRDPHVVERLGRLAAATRNARRSWSRLLTARLAARPLPGGGAEIDLAAFRDLPEVLVPHALALAHRLGGAPYPASADARGELLRQIARGTRIGCDCGGGWRWEGSTHTLRLLATEPKTPQFTYTLDVPGAIEVPELTQRATRKKGSES